MNKNLTCLVKARSDESATEMNDNQVYAVKRDVINMTPNEVYGIIKTVLQDSMIVND